MSKVDIDDLVDAPASPLTFVPGQPPRMSEYLAKYADKMDQIKTLSDWFKQKTKRMFITLGGGIAIFILFMILYSNGKDPSGNESALAKLSLVIAMLDFFLTPAIVALYLLRIFFKWGSSSLSGVNRRHLMFQFNKYQEETNGFARAEDERRNSFDAQNAAIVEENKKIEARRAEMRTSHSSMLKDMSAMLNEFLSTHTAIQQFSPKV